MSLEGFFKKSVTDILNASARNYLHNKQQHIQQDNEITINQLAPYYSAALDALDAFCFAVNQHRPAHIVDMLEVNLIARYKEFDDFRRHKLLLEPEFEDLQKILELKQDYEHVILGIPYPD